MIKSTDYFEKFNNSHAESVHGYLHASKQTDLSIVYEVKDKAPEFISEYASHRLTELQNALKSCNDADKSILRQTAKLVYQDYRQELHGLSWFGRAIHTILMLCNVHQSDSVMQQQIETAYQEIQAQTAPVGLASTETDPDKLKQARELHRTPTAEKYGDVALTKTPYKDEFDKLMKDHKTRLDAISKPDVKAIEIAKLKEEACRKVYQDDLPKVIEKGYYNPAIIAYDIEFLLGKPEELKEAICTHNELYNKLNAEIEKYKNMGKLNSHQAKHLQHDAKKIAKNYLKAFPTKSFRDAFLLTRDLIRLATYQEVYDKSSFNGSDHGTKHIHHNISNGFSLHKLMHKGKDYNVKDKFMEQLIHFYHDIGYSVGLANKDFDCCKDHNFIGAKMIEENRAYFLHYTDQTCYETLQDCVLCHPIVHPDMTAREEKDGLHPGMIRAVTSISDACAVTYDRKTQDFWEQPRAVLALARLKTFLVIYPDYQKKLGDDIVKGPWKDYDEKNPWDRMAYDVFLKTVKELNSMVDDMVVKNEFDSDKADLFRGAIKWQFNAFKTTVTLGQYGAVLAKVKAVRNPKKEMSDQPDYLPQFNLAPSLVYGVLKDLFGEDQANEAFKKLVDEFSGNADEMKNKLQSEMKTKLQSVTSGKAKSEKVQTPTAIFKLMGKYEDGGQDTHISWLNQNLHDILSELNKVFKPQKKIVDTYKEILAELDKWYEKNKSPEKILFATFVLDVLVNKLDRSVKGRDAEFQLLMVFAGKKETLNEKEYSQVKNAIKLMLMSDEEYAFMCGETVEKASRTQVLQQALS
jgi:hypothetical protein